MVAAGATSCVPDNGAQGLAHPRDPGTGDQPPAVSTQVLDEGVEQVHRVQLRLLVEHHSPGVLEGHRQLLAPAHRQPHPRRGVELGPRLLQTAPVVRRVGHRRAHLVRHVVLVAVPQQPVPALAVALDVPRDHLLGLPSQELRVAGALEQRDLGGAVPGRHGAGVTRLEDDDLAAGPGEQQRGHQPGDAGTDDDVVAPLHRLVGGSACAGGAPHRGHGDSFSVRRGPGGWPGPSSRSARAGARGRRRARRRRDPRG